MGWTKLYFLLFKVLSALALNYNEWGYNMQNLSNILLSGFDTNVSPCTDFYAHVCGNSIKRHSFKSVFDMTVSELYSAIQDVLENQDSQGENEKLSKEKKFYTSCMDTGFSVVKGEELFINMLDESAGTNWQNVLEYYASKVGEVYLFDIKLNDAHLLEIARPRSSETNKHNAKYMSADELDFKIDILSNLTSGTTAQMNNNEKLQLKLFIVSINQLAYTSFSETPEMTILELQNFYNNRCSNDIAWISWYQLFKKLAAGSGMNFEHSDRVEVDQEYLIQLCHILNSTLNNVIVNYLHYNFIMNSKTIGFIDPTIQKIYAAKRSVYCIDSLPIQEEINNQVVEIYVPHKSQEIINFLFESLKDELKTEIRNSWLDHDLKVIALEKVHGIKCRFSNMFNHLSEEIRKFISYNFEIGRVGLQNLINFKKAQIKTDILFYRASLNLPRRKRDISLRAFYHNVRNDVDLMLGLITPPTFHQEAPLAFIYGRTAFFIGHELSHAFDNIGLHNTFEDMSMKIRVASTFNARADCLINQYNQFNINGEETFHENTADTQGIKLAFRAMNRLLAKYKEEGEKKLPNLEFFNFNQLFFVSFANQWCTHPQKDKYFVGGTYSPVSFRVNVPLMTMNEFAQTFDCKPNQPMNPIVKCDLWAN